MKREVRNNLVLLVLAAGLAAWLLWDRGRVSTAEADSRKLQIFDAWRPNDVTAVTLTLDKRTIELTRKDENGEASWSMRQDGADIPVDDQAVDDLLLSLEYAGYARRVEAEGAAAMGLEVPRMTVTVTMGKLRYVLRVGGDAASPAGSRYAEVEGGARPKTAYVLKRELVQALEEEPRALRSKRLVPYLSGEVARYEVSGADGAAGFTLSRGTAGGRATVDMLVEAPGVAKQRASFRTVDGWVTTLAKLDALRFLEADAVPAAAAHPARLKVVPRDGTRPTAELELGGACPDGRMLVRRKAPDPVSACVDEKLLAGIAVPAALFVDGYALGVPQSDVSEIMLKDDAVTVDLARRGEGWHLRKPDDSQIDGAIGNALVERLAKVEGEPVAERDEEKLGLKAPRAHVRIVGLPDRNAGPDGKENVEELDVGSEQKGEVYVRRGDGVVLRVGAEVTAALLPAPSALRPTQILDVKLDEVRALALDCDGKRQRVTRDEKGTWAREEPASALGADPAACGELAEAVRTLTAVRWDAEKPEARHALDKPWCRITLMVAPRDADAGDEHGAPPAPSPASKTRAVEILLGAETGGGYFATRAGAAPGAVFVAPRPLGLMARQWLLDRGALMIEAADVDRVTIAAGERTLELARRGDSWIVAGTAHPNDTRAASAGKALEALLAEGVVAIGPPDAARDKELGLDKPKARITVLRREGKPKIDIVVGAADLWRDTRVHWVRAQGIDATFAVAQARLQPILEAP